MEPKWRAAVNEFNHALTPVEHHAAIQLKARISALSDRPQLLVSEFRNFPALLLRKNVSQALETEREKLLAQLQGHLEDLKSSFDNGSGVYIGSSGPPQGKNLSSLVAGVVWGSQLVCKAQQTTAIVERVLPNVMGMERFLATARELTQRVSEYNRDLFTRWVDDTTVALRDKDDSLFIDTKGVLMELDLDAGGELKVRYGEGLVILLREVRQLSELGFSIPPEIQKVWRVSS